MNKKIILGLVLALVAGLGISHLVRAYSGAPSQILVETGYFTISGMQSPDAGLALGIREGASATTDLNVTNELQTAILSVTQSTTIQGSVYISGTTTLGYTLNQLNTPQVSLNAATTTNCAVQNTSGSDRIISAASINLNAGSSVNTANTQWRGYVSAARADGNTSVTGTLIRQFFISSSTNPVAYGGAVPTSYLVTSTLPFITGAGTASTTLVLWPNSWWANVTSSAITTSTGNCVFSSNPF